MAENSRLYLVHKELSVVSYKLLLSVLEYQTAVMRKVWRYPREPVTNVVHENAYLRESRVMRVLFMLLFQKKFKRSYEAETSCCIFVMLC